MHVKWTANTGDGSKSPGRYFVNSYSAMEIEAKDEYENETNDGCDPGEGGDPRVGLSKTCAIDVTAATR